MSLKDHGFFKAIERCNYLFKHAKAFGSGQCNRLLFLQSLKEAHPFIFDRYVSMEKRFEGRTLESEDADCFKMEVESGAMTEIENLAEEFSLPFSTTLYLMTGSPGIHAPIHQGAKMSGVFTLQGYLIKEISPEDFTAWEVCSVELDGDEIPYINQFNINTKLIESSIKQCRALGVEIFNEMTEAHVLKETASILKFTDSISVKRIGIERVKNFNIKTKGIGTGITVYKYDNIIHIADKVEYLYTKPLDDAEINWEHVGYWRGHWRAFYVKDSIGHTRKDELGWNMVDYGRLGKDRAGNYNVPGYTWVKEHTKGDPRLAEIKTRTVKHGP